MSRNSISRTVSVVLLAGASLCAFSFSISPAQDEFVYEAGDLRNPFMALVTSDGRLVKLESPEKKGEIALEGIIYDKHGLSYAVANGSVVKIGDFVGGYQVLKIEQNKISLIKQGQVKEIELKKEE